MDVKVYQLKKGYGNEYYFLYIFSSNIILYFPNLIYLLHLILFLSTLDSRY